MEKKKEIKDQFVIAYLTDLENTKAIIDNSITFAKLLDKGLILLHISDPKYNNISTKEAELKLQSINSSITEVSFHSYCAIEGSTREILNNIPHFLSGVLLITSVDTNSKNKANSPKILLDNLYTSRIAYFVDNIENTNPLNFDNIILTLENFRESKEKVLWASYFGRFVNSEITIYYHKYKDEYFQKQLKFNIAFAAKMFKNFSLNYNYFDSENTKTFVDHQAIQFAKEENASLVICQTTKNKDWTNTLFGLNEYKTIQNKENIPILFVNPREDLFILCE